MDVPLIASFDLFQFLTVLNSFCNLSCFEKKLMFFGQGALYEDDAANDLVRCMIAEIFEAYHAF